MKAVHFTELRQRIDELRQYTGLARFSYTDPILVPNVTVVKALHLAELRTALNDVYVAVGRTRTHVHRRRSHGGKRHQCAADF